MSIKKSPAGFIGVFLMLLIAGFIGVIIAANFQSTKQFVADQNVLGVFTTNQEVVDQETPVISSEPKLFGIIPLGSGSEFQLGPLKIKKELLTKYLPTK